MTTNAANVQAGPPRVTSPTAGGEADLTELSRLRAVVEAVQALPERWREIERQTLAKVDAQTSVKGASERAGYALAWRHAARALEDALACPDCRGTGFVLDDERVTRCSCSEAPVPSSGEAESGVEPRSWPQRVDVAEIDIQREKGWPDFHPEDFCHRCGHRNVSWYVESEAWNTVMRGGDPAGWGDWQEIICPPCFTELAEPHGLTSWRLTRDERGSWSLVPAPVLSGGRVKCASDADRVEGTSNAGGQADGEGEGLTEVERDVLRLAVWPVDPQPDPGCRDLYRRVEAAVEQIVAARLAARPVPQADGVGECCAAFTEAACEVGHRILIDDGDGTDYACPVCALAARPVLSREALRERMDGHWPTWRMDPVSIRCDCGWSGPYDGSAGNASAWRDHLADVLAGGEQA